MTVKLSTYNNEAIASFVLAHYISVVKKVSYPHAMVVLPFLLHDQTASRLRNRAYKRSLDEFIIANVDALINFNKRYTDLLPVSVNAAIILNEMGIVRLVENQIIFNGGRTNFNVNVALKIGNRSQMILSSIGSLTTILGKEPDWSMYLKLKIFL